MLIEGLPVPSVRRLEIKIDGTRYSLTVTMHPHLVEKTIRDLMQRYPEARVTGSSVSFPIELERLAEWGEEIPQQTRGGDR